MRVGNVGETKAHVRNSGVRLKVAGMFAKRPVSSVVPALLKRLRHLGGAAFGGSV
jgi:hypothetical protein